MEIFNPKKFTINKDCKITRTDTYILIDNFLSYPDYVFELSKKLIYENSVNNNAAAPLFRNKFKFSILSLEFFFEKIHAEMNIPFNGIDYSFSIQPYEVYSKKIYSFPHKDGCKLAGVLYFGDDTPGTILWENDNNHTGYSYVENKEISRDLLLSLFQVKKIINSKFNRLVIYDSNIPHSIDYWFYNGVFENRTTFNIFTR